MMAAVGGMALLALVASAAGWTDEARTRQMIETVRTRAGGQTAAAMLILGLLATDLVLPAPSSILMTLSGTLLGTLRGALISFSGAMASAWLGYILCRRFGRGWFRRTAGVANADRAEALMRQYGPWAIVLSRSVPMLTELISCAAGLAGMPQHLFMFLSAIGTLPICVVYAWAGAQGADPVGLRWAVLLAFVVPAIALGLVRFIRCGSTNSSV